MSCSKFVCVALALSIMKPRPQLEPRQLALTAWSLARLAATAGREHAEDVAVTHCLHEFYTYLHILVRTWEVASLSTLLHCLKKQAWEPRGKMAACLEERLQEFGPHEQLGSVKVCDAQI